MAAPMVFELPFDLIVMTRTYPPIPPDPALYRALFFAPPILIEITTLSLLTLSPMVKLAPATFISFAAMLAVFAVWALAGFGYPSVPVPFALNVVSKLLAFVTVLTLFLPRVPNPRRSRARKPDSRNPKLLAEPSAIHRRDAADQPVSKTLARGRSAARADGQQSHQPAPAKQASHLHPRRPGSPSQTGQFWTHRSKASRPA